MAVTVVRTPTIKQVNALSVPGIINQYAGHTAPAGWFLCSGQEVSISQYQNLYNVLTLNGTVFPYGANTNGSGASGTTHFRIPNLKGKVPVGIDSSDLTFDILGETGGAKTHTLTSAEMPSHTHIQDPHKHWISAMSVDDRNLTGTGSNTQDYGTVADAGSYSADDQNSSYGSNTLAQVATNQNTGGGGAHNNLQPFIVLNYIIKY